MNAMPALLAVLLGAFAQDKHNPPPIPGWESDLKAGYAEAKRTGRPLMVVFR